MKHSHLQDNEVMAKEEKGCIKMLSDVRIILDT
jgi:hypothetical protein